VKDGNRDRIAIPVSLPLPLFTDFPQPFELLHNSDLRDYTVGDSVMLRGVGFL
jgi:hypothetical protein